MDLLTHKKNDPMPGICTCVIIVFFIKRYKVCQVNYQKEIRNPLMLPVTGNFITVNKLHNIENVIIFLLTHYLF